MKLYYLLLLLLSSPSFCQQLSNVRATVDSTTVTILYDLKGSIDGQLFTVDLYSSHNEYDAPLLYVSGDVGKDIQPGTDKKIVWQTKEINNFDGQVTFDVRAVLTFSPFLVKSPKLASTYRRGKDYLIEWAGGIPSESANLELYRKKLKISSITIANNTGSYQWQVPKKLKAGNNYQIKISSVQKPENSMLSQNFKIGRRIPLLLKALPIAAAGMGIYWWLTPPKEKPLPAPDRPQ